MSFLKRFFHKLLHGRKFFILFLSVFLWLLLEPLLLHIPAIYQFFLYLYIILSIIIMYVISPNRFYFLTYSISLIVLVVLRHLSGCYPHLSVGILALTLSFLNSTVMTVIIIWYTAAKKKYSRDDIFAGILAFLLIGICFAEIYFTLHAFSGGVVHFAKAGVNIADISQNNATILLNDFLYFSYTTLTTVGYGDIYPVSDIAKRLCSIEACAGVLYLAVFIGRMVMMYEAPDKIKKE